MKHIDPTPEIIKKEAAEEGRDPGTRKLLLVIGIIAVLMGLFTTWAIVDALNEQDDKIGTTIEIAEDSNKVAKESQKAAEKLSKQIEEEGGIPSVDVDKLPTIPDVPSDSLDVPTASNQTIQDIVTGVLLDFNRTGRFNGRDGVSPAAPKDGKEGKQGEPGESITGPMGPMGPIGPMGPGPSDEQVGGRVSDYCEARGDCKGDKGDPPKSWTFTFTAIEYTCTDADEDGHYECVAS